MPGAACAWANEGMAKRQNRKKLMMPLGLRPVMEMYMGYLSFRPKARPNSAATNARCTINVAFCQVGRLGQGCSVSNGSKASAIPICEAASI